MVEYREGDGGTRGRSRVGRGGRGAPRGIDREPIGARRAGSAARTAGETPARGPISIAAGLGKTGANTFRGTDDLETNARFFRREARAAIGRRAGRTWRRAEVTDAHAWVSEGPLPGRGEGVV